MPETISDYHCRIKTRIDRLWLEIRRLTIDGERILQEEGDKERFKRQRQRILELQDSAKKLERKYNIRAKDPYVFDP